MLYGRTENNGANRKEELYKRYEKRGEKLRNETEKHENYARRSPSLLPCLPLS